VDHADGHDRGIAIDDLAIERREQRRRGGPVEARVVEEDL
jgi:hypothetical protein